MAIPYLARSDTGVGVDAHRAVLPDRRNDAVALELVAADPECTVPLDDEDPAALHTPSLDFGRASVLANCDPGLHRVDALPGAHAELWQNQPWRVGDALRRLRAGYFSLCRCGECDEAQSPLGEFPVHRRSIRSGDRFMPHLHVHRRATIRRGRIRDLPRRVNSRLRCPPFSRTRPLPFQLRLAGAREPVHVEAPRSGILRADRIRSALNDRPVQSLVSLVLGRRDAGFPRVHHSLDADLVQREHGSDRDAPHPGHAVRRRAGPHDARPSHRPRCEPRVIRTAMFDFGSCGLT